MACIHKIICGLKKEVEEEGDEEEEEEKLKLKPKTSFHILGGEEWKRDSKRRNAACFMCRKTNLDLSLCDGMNMSVLWKDSSTLVYAGGSESTTQRETTKKRVEMVWFASLCMCALPSFLWAERRR